MKELVGKIIKASQSRGKLLFLLFSVTLNSIISIVKSLNKVTLDANKIEQNNEFYVIYSVVFLMSKSCMRFTSGYIHQDITVLCLIYSGKPVNYNIQQKLR